MKPGDIKKEFARPIYRNYKKIIKQARYTAHLRTARLIINALKKKQAKILDLGCGPGDSSSLFFEKGYRVTGIDLSQDLLKHAKKLSFQKLICQDIEKPLKVLKNHFDAAVMTGVMEYLDHPLKAFKQANNALKKGGYLGVTIPNKITKEREIGIHTYHQKDIEPLFKQAGFKIERKITFHGWYWITQNKTQIKYTAYLLKKE
ncbi:methyltransferase domain-containing protein [Candidatus Woesearchaeota archaeon]|nr:methyltransferase domain-containing protein [Candidatus Woesearchaeota archaeon]